MGKPITPSPMNAVLAIVLPLHSLSLDQAPVEPVPAFLIRRQHEGRSLEARRQIMPAIDIAVVATRLAMQQDAGGMVPGHQLAEEQEMHLAAGDADIFGRGTAQALHGPDPIAALIDPFSKLRIAIEAGQQGP